MRSLTATAGAPIHRDRRGPAPAGLIERRGGVARRGRAQSRADRAPRPRRAGVSGGERTFRPKAMRHDGVPMKAFTNEPVLELRRASVRAGLGGALTEHDRRGAL